MRLPKNFFAKNLEAVNYFEILIISAASSIIVIRFYLHLTNYPQIGGGGLHIAHMLWGGLLMLIAIIIVLYSATTPSFYLASLTGGVGFGFFIDELGKFITHDNNYFFEPAISIIYLIFIILFLIFHFLMLNKKLSQKDLIENAFDLTKEAVFSGNPKTADKAEKILSQLDPANPISKNLKNILSSISSSYRPTAFDSIIAKISQTYFKIIAKRWFVAATIIFFIAISVFNLYRALDTLTLFLRLSEVELTPFEIGQFLSAILASIIIVVAIFALIIKKSRLTFYKLLKNAILVLIFLTQFFDFYNNQLSAVLPLIIYLGVLLVLHYIIIQESKITEGAKRI